MIMIKTNAEDVSTHAVSPELTCEAPPSSANTVEPQQLHTRKIIRPHDIRMPALCMNHFIVLAPSLPVKRGK
jgi:hypothetical protein